jgi:hypothetical protein
MTNPEIKLYAFDNLTHDQRDVLLAQLLADQLKAIDDTRPRTDAGRKALKAATELLRDEVQYGDIGDAITTTASSYEAHFEGAFYEALSSIYPMVKDIEPLFQTMLHDKGFDFMEELSYNYDLSFLTLSGSLIPTNLDENQIEIFQEALRKELLEIICSSVELRIDADAIQFGIEKHILDFLEEKVTPMILQAIQKAESGPVADSKPH